MWSFVTAGPSAVEFIFLISGTLMALSHIIRPDMWVDFFGRLHAEGSRGVLTRTFMLELWPALLVVTFHQVWSGIGIVLTIYGWLQLTKIAISVMAPELGLKSLAMAQRGSNAFRIGGLALLAVSASAGAALFLGW